MCSFSALALLLCSTPPASGEFEPLHCLACGVGFFRDQATKTCSACPQGASTFTYSNASSPLHCLCRPGFENASQACELCASDFFKGGLENRSCTPCTANAFGAAGAVSHLNCTCKAGFEPYDNVCNLCPTGKYKNETTNIGIAMAHFLATTDINLARACSGGNCPTLSSGYWGGEARYHPSKVVDGDLSLTNTFHSHEETNPWVTVDLQQSMYVNRVRIYNRGECCQQRLTNFEIRIGNSATLTSNTVCVTNQPNFLDFQDFTCVMSGRYVSLRVIGFAILNFREFEVYGTKIIYDTTLYKCPVCPQNTATNDTGTVVCEACAAGKTTDGRTGQVECVCDVGTEPGADGLCQTCRAGRYKAASTDKYASRACVNCSSCAAGQQVATECNSTLDVTCRACQANSWSSAGRKLLEPCLCNAGYELQGGLCVACAVGKYRQVNNDNSILCETCGAGNFTSVSATITCGPCSGICQTTACKQVLYDFTPYRSISTWMNYATNIGATANFNEWWGAAVPGIYKSGTGGTVTFVNGYYIVQDGIGNIQMTLPPEFNHVEVSFQAVSITHCVLEIDGVIKATATASTVQVSGMYLSPVITYKQDYTPGQKLIVYERGIMGHALTITLRRSCESYVKQECNASRDVICQECQTCGPGFYVNNTCGASYGNDRLDTQCALCPADSYCPGGSVSQAALACPANRTSAPGSDALADCLCDPGFYRSGLACVPCAPGTFSTGYETSLCTACPAHSSHGVLGVTDVFTCECAAGFWKRLVSPGFVCSECLPGHFCPGVDALVPCAFNTFSTGGNATSCTGCAPFSWATANASLTSPNQCQCRQGTSGAFDDSCTPCDAGYFQPGDYIHGGADSLPAELQIQQESGGSVGAPAAQPTVCVACARHTFQNTSGASACYACPLHSSTKNTASATATECTCDPGYFGVSGQSCAECEANNFCPGVFGTEMNPCRAHSQAGPRARSEDDCKCIAGFYAIADGAECHLCPTSSYCPGDLAVLPCANLSSSNPGSPSIVACECLPGHWRGCIRNAAGVHVDQDDRPCSIDYAGACVECGADDICFNETLMHCPQHSTAAPGSDDARDCVCDPGFLGLYGAV